jgi:RND family efflux transporter MFP subunit
MNILAALSKHALTAGIVAIAVLAALFKYGQYLNNPWTRNGMVRANVIQVTPRVSGPIVDLPIVDNQAVKKGDLLFRIDPRTFQEALDSTTAEEVRTKADFDRGEELIKTGDISKRDYDAAVAAYDVAKSDKESARLDLEFTEVRAPTDGYITNLDLRIGSQAVANQPVMALVDIGSYWIDGYFRETMVGNIEPGDKALVTLMTYPDESLTGTVDSIGWGIAQTDGSTSYELLPQIEPTFEWIRLAQRVPVRIQLDNVPDSVKLRVGTTASVLVKAGD